MAMRLAAASGQYDVDSMLDQMTSQQFEEWVAYYMVEQWGNEGIKQTIANAASIICHMLGAKITPQQIMGIEDTTDEISPNEAAKMFGAMIRVGNR